MQFGWLTLAHSPSPEDDYLCIEQQLTQACYAEQLGFDDVWLTEHNFTGESVFCDPIPFASTLAARTSRVRIGFAVIQMALRHPGRRVLILASDLRQVTPGAWDFERHVPRSAEFLAWLRRMDLMFETKAEVELTVCGFHSETPARTSRSTAVSYHRTRVLWEQVFTAWRVKGRIGEDCFRTAAPGSE